MKTWNLGAGDPLSLTIAADTRITATDYPNDQIWELSLGWDEPPVLALQTTLGLRAHYLRMFPRFVYKDMVTSDIVNYQQPPRVMKFFSNYLDLSCIPFADINVRLEYWVASSQVISGRLVFLNPGTIKKTLRLEWVSVLSSMGVGEGMAVVPMEMINVLQGKTEGLSPVLFMTGGPQPGGGPYPALSLNLELEPGNSHPVFWSLATLPETESSFNSARRATTYLWDAHIAQNELINSSQMLEVETSDPDWDTAFALTQKVAYGLFLQGNQNLPNPSFVMTRGPNQGFSLRGTGMDYNHLWNGQTLLDAYYLASLILPGGADLVKGVVQNFLAVQDERGFIDWKPGLAGQRSRNLAQPLLATLAWQIHQCKADRDWLAGVYPCLLRFLKLWFDVEYDQDNDGFPEWKYLLQSGFDYSPMTSKQFENVQGIDITKLECPSLAVFLYRECSSLIKIARLVKCDDDLPWLLERSESLRRALEETWNPQRKRYMYRDFQTHDTLEGFRIINFQGSGLFPCAYQMNQSRRLLVRLQSNDEDTRVVRIKLVGNAVKGEIIEEVPPKNISWINHQACYTSQNVFQFLDRVEISGLKTVDKGWIATIDYTQSDLTTYMPLWAGIPDALRAKSMIEESLLPEHLQLNGLSACPTENLSGSLSAWGNVQILWNTLIGEGLLAYGYRSTVADLISRMMRVIIYFLKQDHAFREIYHYLELQAFGERNHLDGLAPLGLFLKTLGLVQLSERQIVLDGVNPFPFPVVVKYKRINIRFSGNETVVSFPGRRPIKVSGVGIQRISLS